MSTQAQQIAQQIAEETQESGNKKERVANGFLALDRDKAEIDGSNLTSENIESWKDKLELSESDTLDTVVGRNAETTKSLTIGGLKATSLNNADSGYTKNVVAKPDGTIGWEDKLTTLPIIPKVEIVSFKTSDATNFILTIVLTGVVGSMTSPYWRVFISSGTGTNVEATGIQILAQDTASYQLPNSINAVSVQQQIVFPKSSNTSALWTNTAATSIMITAEFIGAHNTDVASGTIYSVPRVGIDTKLKQKILI